MNEPGFSRSGLLLASDTGGEEMELSDAWIHGLRRFGGETPHRVRFDTKLVCLTGANESGKSTVLDAMEIAHEDTAVEAPNRTRREEVPDGREIVRLRYRLDDQDRAALRTISTSTDLDSVRWFEVIRNADGGRALVLNAPLRRNRAGREPMLQKIREEAERWWPSNLPEEEYDEMFRPEQDRVERLSEALGIDTESLADEVVDDLRELSSELIDEDPDFAEGLRELAEHEGMAHPDLEAQSTLMRRAPGFVRFNDQARRLESEYDLSVAADDPGAALRNLASLGGLDLIDLRNAIAAGETGTIRDLREATNDVLKERFEAWQQKPEVTVVLETEGMLLRIHVQSGSGPTMPFHERSDGLRQFVALVALTAQENLEIPPVLLIDEIETHLNYDAQADLIEVLASQNTVSQVLYTTHSSACLPEDLGRGVRVVEPLGEQTASTVRQSFWKDEHPGMGALLMAMGAASMAYVPLRPAAIAEGGSDMVMLPSLICEAADRDHLGYPLVPGASSTPPERLAGLGLQGVRTAWVFDSDESGRDRQTELIAAGIPAERILLLDEEDGLEIEDLVDPVAYCAAVNSYLQDLGTEVRLEVSDLPEESCRRPEALTNWCEANGARPPGKVAIANKVVDLAGEMPLVDPAHAERLRDLHSKLEQLLRSED
ncbi:MAG TPA: ATP-binding protein [Solirubrobacterales bacterium]|nr:ATP-binding protein [Solirubrobacterales bacterium]